MKYYAVHNFSTTATNMIFSRQIIAQLRAENAALRQTLIDATGQRDEYYRQLIARLPAPVRSSRSWTTC